MSTKAKIDGLWNQMRDAIDATYAEATNRPEDDRSTLHDYARNISWSDDLAGLLGRETANERQHRSNRPSVPGFSTESAAKLILMNAVSTGSQLPHLPKSTLLLVLRKTAVEAEVIGYLISGKLSQEWRDNVANLDYSKLMK